MLPAVPEPLRPIVDVATRIARGAPSTPVVLDHLHRLLPEAAFPEEVRAEALAALQDAHDRAAVPLDGKTVERALRDAWGTKPSSVLDDLDDEPAAVTATSQVHRGELDGEAVAVKIRRPGVGEGIRRDLQLLDTLARPLGAAFPGLDPGALLREVRERVLDELDLEHEGSNQRRVQRALRRDPDLVVPAVHGEQTTEAVLVSGWLAGEPLTAAAAGLDDAARSRVARALVRLHLGSTTAVGMVLADPRPDDVLLLADGRVGVVDLAAAPADRDRVGPALASLQALRDGDEDAFAVATATLRVAPEDVARAAFGLAREIGGDMLAGPVRADAAMLATLRDRAFAHADDGVGLALRATPHPADLWALRMLGQLGATLAWLGAEEDWLALALAAGRTGWV